MVSFERATLTILIALLVGCGESAEPVSSTSQAVAEPTPKQKFAAELKEAEAGNVNAQFNLGNMYSDGEGVPKDAAKAIEWFRRAAEQGGAKAQFNLGVMYVTGEGVPKDEAKAVEWFRRAAEQGHASAQVNLGVAYNLGEGVPKDVTKAVEWWNKAAEQGDAKAQASLGYAYSNGEGVSKDVRRAIEWLNKAAERGDAAAQNNLGVMYSNGEGVPKDVAKAVEWYRKAAEAGDANAQYSLGWRYGGGDGVPLDQVLAYAWLNLAAVSGDESAKKARELLEHQLSSAQRQEAQALSSKWKPGQSIVRESTSVAASTVSTSNSSPLAKQSTGTGFVVANTGQTITNYHVVAGCAELHIEGRAGIARVITDDKVNDLALLLIPGNVAATASIAKEPQKLRQGEDIVVFGFPLNSALSSGGNFTPGVVSALTGLGNNTNQMQITAPIQPGSSGSPVLNKKGEVVGVVSMKLSDSKMVKATGSVGQNVNFAISGLTLKTFLDTHKVDYSYGGMLSFDKSAADLADEARKWTLVVECWK